MDSDDSRIGQLVIQCRNNDVDVKIDALTKLQVECESGSVINDPDGLINVLKACLRTSNQHLTAATLSVLPPLLPLLVSHTINPLVHTRNITPPSVSSSTSSSAPSALVDIAVLRQVLTAFLPAGGLIERLGDKERPQAKAREALVILGGLAFRSSGNTSNASSRGGKGPETPLAIYERFLREGGLASKVWKVREQSILILTQIRKKHHLFPIRPYLTLLVDCLEDTDAHVRDCARQSVIELFSGPGVTDGARADLKKEMIKKNVRKTIVDSVLAKLLGNSVGSTGSGASAPHSREGSENGDAPATKGYVPPSLALAGRRATTASGIPRTASHSSVANLSRPASRAALESPVPATPTSESSEIRPVYIASARDLEQDFAGMAKPFEGKETEHNWAAREQSVLRVRGMLKGDVHLRYTETLLACFKDGFIQWSLKALASLRTTVSANTSSLYAELAVAFGTALDPFCEVLLTNLLKMAGFTKKIAAQQSQASVTAIITHTSGAPRIFLSLLWHTLQEKTVQARAFMVAHFKQYIEVHGHRSKAAIESSGGLDILEKSMKKALADPNPAVRVNARVCFWVFEDVWHERGLVILESLDATARKQLEKACPNPAAAAALPPVTPKATKKTSVAAAIAASRAKAKAIATAPPSLRHQATSASSHVPPKRPGSPSQSPRASVGRPSSPLRMSTSPPSPRARIVSTNSMPRSASSSVVSVAHARTPSSGARRSTSPSSTADDQPSFHRRASSPLASGTSNTTSTIRRAIATALPASPPSEPGSPTPRNNNTTQQARTVIRRPPARDSTFPDYPSGNDSLLLAQSVPIPDDDDTDSEDDRSMNLMSFSAALEKYATATPAAPKSNQSQEARSFSPKSVDSRPMAGLSTALSSDSVGDLAAAAAGQPVVEDALRARAEQAESAAERLLELVDPDDEGGQHSTIPASLLLGSNGLNGTPASKVKSKPMPLPITQGPPVTPNNRSTAILRQAALFKDSPAYNGHAASFLDVLQDRKHETGWWLKRMTLIAQGIPLNSEQSIDELRGYISILESGAGDVDVLQKLAMFCKGNPIVETSSPTSPNFPSSPSPFIVTSVSASALHSDMWEKDKNFERLFNALVHFLEPSKSEEELEYGLILLWEMLENQAIYIEGREGDILSLLLKIRYCNKLNVLEATNTIRDALTSRVEPVYGLTTMHGCLRTFYAESAPETAEETTKAATYAFGLIALGKFLLRLPAEIAEEELPRLRGTLITSLNDKSSLVVRESAAAAIIAAQLVLRDETHLFALLDGLADEKKNLLTYLFDKHGARGLSKGLTGMDKLEKEMRRLDARTSMSPRPPPSERYQ